MRERQDGAEPVLYGAEPMSSYPANWYADPMGRHELRYWDGAEWTEHVSDQGRTGTDPLASSPAPRSRLDGLDAAMTVGDEGNRDRIVRQVSASGNRGAGIVAPAPVGGTGSVFDEPILVVNQKVKVIELNNQYAVFDQHGNKVGVVNQVGQSAAKKMLRLVSAASTSS